MGASITAVASADAAAASSLLLAAFRSDLTLSKDTGRGSNAVGSAVDCAAAFAARVAADGVTAAAAARGGGASEMVDGSASR